MRSEMTTKRFPLYRDILNLCMIYLMLLSCFMALASGMKMTIRPLEYVGLALMLICSYLMREKIKMLWLSILLHILLTGIFVFWPVDGIGRLKLAVAALVISLLDLRNWITKDKSVHDVMHGLGLIFLVCLILTSGKFEYGYSTAVYYMGVAFVGLILIRDLVKNFYLMIMNGKQDSDMPVREIFRNNALITALIALGSMAAMIFIRSDSLVLALNRLVYNIWKKFAEVIVELFDVEEEYQEQPVFRGIEQMLDELSTEDSGNSFLTMIIRITEAALALFCIVVLAYCAYRLAVVLWRALFSKRELRPKRYKSFQVKNEVRQSLKAEDYGKKNRRFFKTAAEKVRDIYRKELKKFRKAGAGVRNTATPAENRVSVLKNSGMDIGAATALYERVRFRDEDTADAKDVSDIKDLFRKAGR